MSKNKRQMKERWQRAERRAARLDRAASWAAVLADDLPDGEAREAALARARALEDEADAADAAAAAASDEYAEDEEVES